MLTALAVALAREDDDEEIFDLKLPISEVVIKNFSC
jgi:hypothetical protein